MYIYINIIIFLGFGWAKYKNCNGATVQLIGKFLIHFKA